MMALSRRFAAAVALLFSLCAAPLAAATLTEAEDPVMGCFATLSGLIESGDAAAVAKLIERRNEAGSPFDDAPLPHGNRICLDSEGGSLSEGVKLSKLFNAAAVGTAVGRGQKCLSACALAFMGGIHNTESDIGDLTNRVLHPLGRLGFHSPSLQIAAGEYNEATVIKAYDVALKSVEAVLELAAQNRFALSLSVQMLKTPASSMYEISTVGEASRWHIAVGPVVSPAKFDELSAIMVCSNIDGQALDYEPSVSVGGLSDFKETPAEDGWIEVVFSEGWRQELATGCRVDFSVAALQSNAIDLAGYAEITEIRQFYLYQTFPPETRIAALARTDDGQAQPVSADFATTRSQIYQGSCLVIAGQEVKDKEPCSVTRIASRGLDLGERVVDTFLWPSGAKTVVENIPGASEDKTKINGAETKRDLMFLDQFSELNAVIFKATGLEAAQNYCWVNPASGNRFCFSEPDPADENAVEHQSYALSLFE